MEEIKENNKSYTILQFSR